MLILAGVSLNAIVGENGILTQAQKVKTKTEVASLKESVERARATMIAEELDETKTASELMYYLADKGILKSDRTTFVENSNYQLIPNGNIMYQGDIVDKVNLTDNKATIEDSVDLESKDATINVKVVIEDGEAQYIKNGWGLSTFLSATKIPEGYKFAYWINNYNDIVDYSNTIIHDYFNNTGNKIKYTAVYVKEDENISVDNCIGLSGICSFTDSSTRKNYIEFTFYRNILSGYTVIEHGVLYSANASVVGSLNDMKRNSYMVFTDNEYNVVPDKVQKDNFTGNMFCLGSYIFFCRIPDSRLGSIVYARGYVVVQNKTTGEKSVYYSRVASGSYNSLQD